MIWILSLILVVVILIPTYVTLAFYLVWHYDRRNFQAPPADGERDPLRGAAVARAILVEAASLTFLSGTYPLRLLHDASPKRARATRGL